MKILFLGLCLIAQPSWGEVKDSDIWRPNGSVKVPWKNMSEEQKAHVLERQRANAEYTIAHQGKRFSELKGIPESLRPREQADPQKVYFSTDAVVLAYQQLGDLNAAARLAKADYEANPERSHGPYKLERLIGLLSDAGRHAEALDLYQKYLQELLPSYSKEDFATKKSVPDNPTYNDAMRFGEELRRKAESPNSVADKSEEAVRMHRAFHSKDRRGRLEAIEFYKYHRVRSMLRKAALSDDPDVREKAQGYIKTLEGK